MELCARIDEARQRWDVLKHPFYERWERGELTREELVFYAGEYRHAVVALARAAAASGDAVHAHVEAEHVALWDEFAAAVDAPLDRAPTPQTSECAVAGAFVAESPADVARRVEAVITMVADPQALADVTEGPDGVAAGVGEGTTVIQMSTVGPDSTARLVSLLAEDALLDSPVLGSISEVESGTLNVFVGGQPELVERWRPLLSMLGTVLRVGQVGAGTAAKLVANATLVGVVDVLGEALAVGDALGLSRTTTFAVMGKTPLAEQAERRRPA